LLAGIVTWANARLGLSLLWGCSVSLLPSACFAWFSFRNYGGARRSIAMLYGLYRAEAFKFLLTAALFAAVFVQVDKIYAPAFFLAFVGGQIASWLVTARALSRQRR
jgi:ATP synthase protein I